MLRAQGSALGGFWCEGPPAQPCCACEVVGLQAAGFRGHDSGVQGSGFRVQGPVQGTRHEGYTFRVQGAGVLGS